MGIVEIHFHDSEFEFEWEFNPSADVARALPFGGGSGSESNRSESGSGSQTSTPSAASKLGPVGLVALVLGGAVAFRRLRSRRARESAEAAAETDDESGGRRLSLSRSK